MQAEQRQHDMGRDDCWPCTKMKEKIVKKITSNDERRSFNNSAADSPEFESRHSCFALISLENRIFSLCNSGFECPSRHRAITETISFSRSLSFFPSFDISRSNSQWIHTELVRIRKLKKGKHLKLSHTFIMKRTQAEHTNEHFDDGDDSDDDSEKASLSWLRTKSG